MMEFLVLFYKILKGQEGEGNNRTESDKLRHNIISHGTWISAVRLLLKSQVLCIAFFSLLLKENWRIPCNLRSRVEGRKKDMGRGVQKEKSKYPLDNSKNNKTKLHQALSVCQALSFRFII